MDKRLKNIRHELLYTYYSKSNSKSNTHNALYTLSSIYLFSNFQYHPYQNLNQVVLPSAILENTDILRTSSDKLKIFLLERNGDLISSI